MGKTAAKKKTTITEDNAQNYMLALDAKQRFIGEALGLGWRLIVTFVIPVVAGAWLDNHYNSKPSYTLVGVFIAVTASVVIIQRTVKDVTVSDVKPAKKGKTRA